MTKFIAISEDDEAEVESCRTTKYHAPATEEESIILLSKDQKSVAEVEVGFYEATVTIFSNIPYLFISLARAFDSIIGVGFGTFVPKFIQTQFGTTAEEAAFYVGKFW